MDLPVVVLTFVLSPVNVSVANDLRVLCAIRMSVAAAAGVRSQDIFIAGFFEVRSGTRTRFNDTGALDTMCTERRRRLASTGRALGDTITALPSIVGSRVDSSSRATTVTTGFVAASSAQAATAAAALKDSAGSGASDSVTVALGTVTGEPAGSFAADVDANSVAVTSVRATRTSFYFVLDIVRRNFYQLVGSVSFVVLYLLLAASCKTPVWKRCFQRPAPVDKRAALRTRLRRANARQRMRIFVIVVRFVGRMRWAVARGLEEEWREMHRDANTESVMLSANASPSRARRPHVPMARRPSWPLYRPPSRTAEDEIESNREDTALLNVDAVSPGHGASQSARRPRVKRSPQQQHQRELARARARSRIHALRSLLLFIVRVSLFSRWRRGEPSRLEGQVAPRPYDIPEKWLMKEAHRLAARHAASTALAASLKETDRALKKNLTKKLLLQLHRLVGSRDTSADVMGVIEAALTSVEAPPKPAKAPLPQFSVKAAPKNPLLEEAAALRKSAISPGALAGASALFGVRPSGLLARAQKTSARGAKSPIAVVRHVVAPPPAAELLQDGTPSASAGDAPGYALEELSADHIVSDGEHASIDTRPSSVSDVQNEVTRAPEDADLPTSPYSQPVPRVMPRGVRPRIDPNEWALKRAASIARAAERKAGARDWNEWDQPSPVDGEEESPQTAQTESQQDAAIVDAAEPPLISSETGALDSMIGVIEPTHESLDAATNAAITTVVESRADEDVPVASPESPPTVSQVVVSHHTCVAHDAVAPRTPSAASISRAFEDALDVFSAAQTTRRSSAAKVLVGAAPSPLNNNGLGGPVVAAAHKSIPLPIPHPPDLHAGVDEMHTTRTHDPEIAAASSEMSSPRHDAHEVSAPTVYSKAAVDKAERLRSSRLERKEDEAKAAVFAKRVERVAAALSPDHDDATPVSPTALREQTLAGGHARLLLPSAIPRHVVALPSIHAADRADDRTPPRTPSTTGIPFPAASSHSTPRRSKR